MHEKIIRLINKLLLLSIYSLIVISESCNNTDNPKQNHSIAIADSSIQLGKTLAVRFCQSCHLLPDPNLLDKKSWRNGVLPGMGPRLGIFEFDGQYYTTPKDHENLPPNYYPKEPLLTQLQWQHIIEYYIATAPDSLPKAKRTEIIISGLPFFTLHTPKNFLSLPTTCFTLIDTIAAPRRIFFGDANTKRLYVCNQNLELIDSINVTGPVVDIAFDNSGFITCNMGYMNPSNLKIGFLQSFHKTSKHPQTYQPGDKKFIGLARPVQVVYTDLNNDKRKDYIICEFGNLTGALVWMEQTKQGKFKRHVLRDAPGVIKTILTDYNLDGLPDIFALFTQAQEGIVLYINKGNGKFEEQQILRFPSVFGSSSFELNDFNKDGYPDILYTCGDNADYSPVQKPYHGIYIFLNDGTNHFSQKYFFPVAGCFKAMARDFDGDGNLDIAAISFFTDPKIKEEGFIYLHNKGGFIFQPYTFPEAADGRWLTMDINDLDGDGKADIILGNLNYGVSGKADSLSNKNASFFLLKNITN